MGLLQNDNLDPWDDGREERRMRTTERTLDTLRSYRVPSPSEMQEIYLDLRDLAAMERERDELRAERDTAVRERGAACAVMRAQAKIMDELRAASTPR